MYHTWSRELDPSTAADTSRILAWEELELKIYEQCDRALARILEAADENTLAVVVSDHGAKPAGPPFRVNDLLADAGLLSYADDAKGEPAAASMLRKLGKRKIDWSAWSSGRPCASPSLPS
jgi:predicted AlkP superfamily phosphohydrolase/phosphomutase